MQVMEVMDNKFSSRKFAIAVAILYALTTALFTGFISGGEYITGITLILGLYGASNVAEKFR